MIGEWRFMTVSNFKREYLDYLFPQRTRLETEYALTKESPQEDIDDAVNKMIRKDYEMVQDYLPTSCDSVLASSRLYHQSKDDMFNYLSESAHRKRLKSLNMERDTKFCLTPPIKSSIIPTLIGDKLIRG